jgi:hypothetical protein
MPGRRRKPIPNSGTLRWLPGLSYGATKMNPPGPVNASRCDQMPEETGQIEIIFVSSWMLLVPLSGTERGVHDAQ